MPCPSTTKKEAQPGTHHSWGLQELGAEGVSPPPDFTSPLPRKRRLGRRGARVICAEVMASVTFMSSPPASPSAAGMDAGSPPARPSPAHACAPSTVVCKHTGPGKCEVA